jgi:spermidine synthase
MNASARFRFILLLVFVTAFCSYAYELVLANVLSVLWGNVVQQYTVTTGIYIAAMGAGAYFTPVRLNAKKFFIWIEISLALLAIISPLIFVYSDVNLKLISPVACYGLITLIGFLSGMELPLLLRILAADSSSSAKEEKALFADYFGMFVAGLLFALFLNRQFGSLQVNLFLALANLALAWICGLVWGFHDKAFRKFEIPLVSVVFLVVAWAVIQNLNIYEEQIARWIIVN